MVIVIVLLMALLVLDIAALRWGFDGTESVDSPEWSGGGNGAVSLSSLKQRHMFLITQEKDEMFLCFRPQSIRQPFKTSKPTSTACALGWMQASRGPNACHLSNAVRHLLNDDIGVEGTRTHKSGAPQAAELGQLFVQGHEGKQVLDPLLNGGVGVAIERGGHVCTACNLSLSGSWFGQMTFHL
jgi:hypothetical protein